AGRPDDRGDEVLVDLHRHALHRRLAAVDRVEVLDVEDPLEPLARRQRRASRLDLHGWLECSRHLALLHHRCVSLRRPRVASQRAPRLANRMKSSSTSAAAHARAWSAGSGCSESSKIATGIDCSAWCGFQLVLRPTIDDVKRSGAVSPATRATASVVPVTIPPIVCGRTTLSVVRQRGTPSARLASRSEFGTSARISIVARETSGSIRQASANEPAKPLWP